MPGHMKCLLAEADVPYGKIMEMEQANEEFPTDGRGYMGAGR
jgi:NAD(P) transhydrogenase subunit beta